MSISLIYRGIAISFQRALLHSRCKLELVGNGKPLEPLAFQPRAPRSGRPQDARCSTCRIRVPYPCVRIHFRAPPAPRVKQMGYSAGRHAIRDRYGCCAIRLMVDVVCVETATRIRWRSAA
jgi:hypothetical protein